MTPNVCPCEQDVLDALWARRWPGRCDEALRDHVAACAICRDLLEAASAVLNDADDGGPAPLVPPASVVWWRAQLRAREQAMHAAARPLRLSLRVAVGCAITLLVLGAIAAAPSLRMLLPDPGSWTVTLDTRAARDAALAAFTTRGVQLAAAAWLVLAPVALYFALADD